MTEKLRLEMDDLTLGELHEVRKLAGAPLEEMMASEDQALGLAAFVTVVKRRTEPDFTLEQALGMKLSELDIGGPDPEARGGGNGMTPQSSPETGP